MGIQKRYTFGNMNALDEYDQYLSEGYQATEDEWRDWAERIIKMFKAELDAVQNDYKHMKALEQINIELLEALEQVVKYSEVGFPLTIVTVQPFKNAIAKAKGE